MIAIASSYSPRLNGILNLEKKKPRNLMILNEFLTRSRMAEPQETEDCIPYPPQSDCLMNNG